MFIQISGKDFTTLLVYIYDLIITSNNMNTIDKIRFVMNQKFKIKDLKKLRYFLSSEVAQCK